MWKLIAWHWLVSSSIFYLHAWVFCGNQFFRDSEFPGLLLFSHVEELFRCWKCRSQSYEVQRILSSAQYLDSPHTVALFVRQLVAKRWLRQVTHADIHTVFTRVVPQSCWCPLKVSAREVSVLRISPCSTCRWACTVYTAKTITAYILVTIFALSTVAF